jgi:hypothetical protein
MLVRLKMEFVKVASVSGAREKVVAVGTVRRFAWA